MKQEPPGLPHVVLTRALRLNPTVQGIVYGLVAGLGLFVATNWLVLKGGDEVGPHMALLGQFLPGYRVTFGGSLIGFVYGLTGGFAGGYFFSRLYNWIVDRREAGSSRPERDAG